ncbi:MAG: IS3 family transposase [Methylococcales bacterium]
MTTQAKQKYIAEFKENNVKRANESSNVAETAHELGIKENTLTNWVYQYSRPLKPDKAVRTDEHLYDELKRLKKEVTRLTEERDLWTRRQRCCQRNTVQSAWILEQSVDYSVALLCSVLSVSRSAYYAWTTAVESRKAKRDKELKTVITAAFTQNRAVYGTRRLKEVLAKQGDSASRRRIGRIMQEAQLVCKTKRRFRATTNSKHNMPIAPNQGASPDQSNQVYVGDITYIKTQEGWLYLAVVIDLYSRQIVDTVI